MLRFVQAAVPLLQENRPHEGSVSRETVLTAGKWHCHCYWYGIMSVSYAYRSLFLFSATDLY